MIILKRLREWIGKNQFYKYHNMVGDNLFIYNSDNILISVVIDAPVNMIQVVWSEGNDRLLTYISLDTPEYLTKAYKIHDKRVKDIVNKAIYDNWDVIRSACPSISYNPLDYSNL